MRQDARHRATPRDAIDGVVEQWERERPDLDPSAKHVVGRIVRLAGLCQDAYDAAFEPLGITGADYGVLAPLRRAGEPFELSPTELARHKLMTSGGMTAALDRLERKGLLERRPNPADRRGTLVRLTEEGRTVVDDAMRRHADAEQALVAGLAATDRDRLGSLLRTLLVSIEGPPAER